MSIYTLTLYNIMSCQCSNAYIYDRSIIYETVEQLSVYARLYIFQDFV